MDSPPTFTNTSGLSLGMSLHISTIMPLITNNYRLHNDGVLSPYFLRKAIALNYRTGDQLRY